MWGQHNIIEGEKRGLEDGLVFVHVEASPGNPAIAKRVEVLAQHGSIHVQTHSADLSAGGISQRSRPRHEGAPFIARHIIQAAATTFDDFAASGTDQAANRRMLGLS